MISMGSRHSRRRFRGLTVGIGVVSLVLLAATGASALVLSGGFGHTTVGTTDPRGTLLPDNQWVKPLGDRSLIRNGRLLSSALSPDGKQVAALSWNTFTGFLTIFNAATGAVAQQVGTGVGTDKVLGDGTVAADGPFYSADGRSLWMSQSSDLLRFAVNQDGTVAPDPVVVPTVSTVPQLPSGMAESTDGQTLYVALNGTNQVGVLDERTNAFTATIAVGIAPRQLALVGGKLFVSNEGGRPAKAGDETNLSYGTPVVADRVTGAVTNGTVSVVDVATRTQTSTIKVGLQPTALRLSGTTLFVANSNGDSVSIVDTAKARVTQTFNVAPLPGSTVGSDPNAIELTTNGTLLVSVGRDNALAAYHYNGPTAPVQYEGLIPTDWYPVNVQWDKAIGKFVVTNDKGIGARGPKTSQPEGPDANVVTGHNTYNDTGSLTRFAPPTEADLAGLTHQVFVNNDWQKLLSSTPLLARDDVAATPIPVRLGDPSSIKHVFLIVKENRTYDQVFGDLGRGNGDPALVQFGGSVTPNEHALTTRYGVFDNFYDEGTLSADGHNWLMQADANDYIEKEFGAFYRSYPAQGGDALAYQRDGFLWNAVQAAGHTAAAFGEYANFQTLPAKGAPTWSDWYKASQVKEGKIPGPSPIADGQYPTYSDINSLNKILDRDYPKFNTDIPDQYRVDIWQQAFAKAERNGTLADFNMLWVPQDHTAGTSGKDPYPTAMVADNDLAVGRIVDTISHSKDWASSAIFVVEDDSQAGVDHVDGHRAPLLILSPYAKRGITDSTYYTQLNLVRTIEQILGVPPMNQEDRAAEPIRDAFTATPDTRPYTALPNQIPLTYGLSTVATSVAAVPQAQAKTAAQWAVWSTHQNFGGPTPQQDAANPQLLNRLDYYTASGWTKPYPGDATILGPYQVPGWDAPAAELGAG